MKALIVEPTNAYRHLLDAVFKSIRFETLLATNADEALLLLSDNTIDLLCTAFELPDMNGIKFCQKIRALEDMRHIPVLLSTSIEDKNIIEAAITAGFTEIFHKSDTRTLENYLNQFISRTTDSSTKSKILYVEDSLSIAQLTTGILEQKGYKVEHFTQAEQAFESFKNEDYDLVLTDVILEGRMSGTALVRAIRSSETNKQHIPILAMSIQDDSARKVELLRSGANDYVSKPILEQELLARVKNLITNKQLLDKVTAQQQKLRQLAMTDQLTSLYNRHCLMELAPKYLSEAFRHKYPISLVVIDLDHFKSINDTHGHSMGDSVLTQTAQLLKNSCRNEDLAARFGGEEFVLILTHCNTEDALNKTESLRKKIENLNPEEISVTASFGIATLPLDKQYEFSELFAAADRAVYKAKEDGRNRIVSESI